MRLITGLRRGISHRILYRWVPARMLKTSSVEIETVLPNITKTIGEGPHWDDVTQTLLFVDIMANDVFRWNPSTNEVQSQRFEKPVGAVVPSGKGGILIGLGRTVSHFDWDTKKVTKLHEVENRGINSRMNDAKCDPAGRFWTGTMGVLTPNPQEWEIDKGELFCLDTNGKLTKYLEKIGVSNGLAWSGDNKSMYYIDSIPRQVYKFDYDIDSGKISNQTVLSDFNKFSNSDTIGTPDGMTIDTAGNLWVACYWGARVVCIDTKTGQVIRTVGIPANRITSCCFGGKNLDEMYVTCCASGAEEEEWKQYPLTGSVFRIKGLGVKGFPANVYKGPISI